MSTGKKILLVDDDVDFVHSNKELLETHGYSVLTAHNGNDAMEVAKKNRPDLIILDVMMTTDTEGFDVSRKLQDIPALKGVPVILLSGIRKAMSLPFKFEPDSEWLPVKVVLEKPVRAETLLQEVGRCF